MSRRAIHFLLPLLILALTATAGLALDLGGHDRDGVVIGLTMGHGRNSIALTDGNGGNRDPGDVSTFTGAFKAGWARCDRLLGFVGISGWKRSFRQDITPTSVTNLNFLAELYFFPTGQGFWAKSGIGTGSRRRTCLKSGALPDPVFRSPRCLFRTFRLVWSAGVLWQNPAEFSPAGIPDPALQHTVFCKRKILPSHIAMPM